MTHHEKKAQKTELAALKTNGDVVETTLAEAVNPTVGRRGFMAGAAGLTFAVSAAGFMTARSADVLAASGKGNTLNAYVTINPDDTVTIQSPAAEMGQGIMTAIPMIIAEELDADWDKVNVVQAPAAPTYGNPKLGGGVITVASRAVDGYWDSVRMAGAQARRVLIDAAAAQWSVPASELSTEPNEVVHKASGKSMSYGDIAKTATVPAELPKLTEADLKKPADFRIVGKSVPRVDVPAKTRGEFTYGMDAEIDGMVYASLLRTPIEGGSPDTVDDAAAKAVKGVVGVFKLKDAVAVVGSTIESTQKGKDALKVTWKPGPAAGFNSVNALPEYAARAENLSEAGLPALTEGDAKGTIAGSDKVYKATYTADYTYHGQMEPMNITAMVDADGKGADVWVGTQAAGLMAFVGSLILQTKPPKIRVHQLGLGGGFGRRIYPDMVAYPLILSKITKKPVKVIFSREDDIGAGKLRPMTAHHLEASVKDGKIDAWHHRLVGESIIGFTGPPQRLKASKGVDPLTMEGHETLYTIPNKATEYLREQRDTALAAWRAIGSGYNKFVIEAFMDEIAHAEGVDPIEFRLRMMDDHRSRRVIEATAKMADWGRTREGTALGFSYAIIWGTRTAGIVEVSVDKATGAVKAHNFWSAVDPGIVVNPDTIAAQTESNVIYGLGQALKERITYDNGAIEQTNYHDYTVMRMEDAPEIHTHVMASDNRPTGIGEIALPLVGGAVSNAIFAATGARVRSMPFTPDRVKEAMKA